jgi:N-methylhydantoinase A
MIRAIRAVSSERGRDPRGFTLVAFGGNGPLFAAGMAAALGIRRVLVPPVPGVFSSFGLLCARLEHHYARSLRTLLRAAQLSALNEAFDDLERQARAQLAAEGVPASAIAIQRRAALHYHGQIYELTVAVPDGAIEPAGVHALEETFGREHERTYGHRAGADEPVELVSVQLIASAADAEPPRLPDAARLLGQEAPTPLGVRPAYFGSERGWLDTPVLRRGALAKPQKGPCIVEEYDATCLVPPGAGAVLDRFGNIVIDL